MKKILSILICLVIGISSAWAVTATIEISATAEPAQGGTVRADGGYANCAASLFGKCISYKWVTTEGSFSTTANPTVTTTATSHDGTLKQKAQVTLYAKENIGYYFIGWYEGTTNISSNKEHTITYDISATGSRAYVAKFAPVTVTGVSTVNHISINELYGQGTGTVVFTVENADETSDFLVSKSSNAFSAEITSISGNNVTVTVTYTDKNHHGTNVASTDVTLTSRGEANSKATATINVTTDLTPKFTKPVDYNFGTIYAGDAKGSQTALYATGHNVSANQASPASVEATGAKWTASITGDGASAFVLTSANPEKGQAVVTFRPTTAGTYNATLNLKVDYTDAYGNTISSSTTTTVLTGVAETPIESAIVFDPISWDFGTQVTGYEATKEFAVSQQNVSNVTYGFGDTNAAGVFSYSEEVGSIVVSANPTTPGTYSATITATGTDTRDPLPTGSTGTTIGTLPLSITVGLQSPVLMGGSNLQNTYYLKWTKVPHATSYEIYMVDGSGNKTLVDNAVDVADDGMYITRSIASTASSTIYVIKAISDYSGGNYESWSNEETVQLNAIAAAGTPYLEIWTGTEKSGSRPYKAKYKVDLSSTFDANGNALFDVLYIFGMTTSSDGTNTITTPNAEGRVSSAITPCYIYNKSGDNGYVLYNTIANMNLNSATKPIPTITANSQKLYFTGFCPYAANGTATEKGVFCITGGQNAQVDLYFEDLYLFARTHTATGSDLFVENDTVYQDLQLWGTAYVDASAAPFVFVSNSNDANNPFRPTIHLRDSNRLDAGYGWLKGELATKEARASIQSAPIHIFDADGKDATVLTIDDKWPLDYAKTVEERTNGRINVCPTSAGRPSIDLGNAKSVLNINGGQIYLQNGTPTSKEYLSTFAIGYRSYTKSVSIASATLAGLGDDQGGGTVNFNDGSIHCKALSSSTMNTYGSYYRSATSMKCPQNTYINGGTIYCDIWACSGPENLGASPKDQYGSQLVTVRFPINNTPEAPFYLATVNFDSIANAVQCQDDTHADYGKTLAQYYNGRVSYGISSLKADNSSKKKAGAKDSVTFMLPYQFTDKEVVQEVDVTNWAMCTPAIVAEGSDPFGGATAVASSATKQTRYLLYAECDDKALEVAGEGASYTSPTLPNLGSVGMHLNGETRNDVTNEQSYEVTDAQYIMRPIVAGDEWILFVPPFDVSNVYVIETYDEDALVAMAEADGDSYNALLEQAKAAIDLLCYLGYYISFQQTNQNLWAIYNTWLVDGAENKGAGAIKLTHFTGRNYDANYYLQRSSGVWEWDGSKFITDWEYLPTTEKVTHGTKEYEVIMKKGEIYSMNFPYKYFGYGAAGNWDYWTGKYLVFEGLGPQSIEGKEYHEEIRRAMETASGTAEIRANNTLAELVVDNAEAYYAFGNAQKFTRSLPQGEDNSLLPGEGFILANAPAPVSMPRRIKTIDVMSGEVTYEEGEGSENGATGTPTIAGNNKMLVYNINGGVGIVPVVAQQVSIYNAAGQVVTSEYLAGETQLSLPAGIYLVCGEHEQYKVLVK